MQGTSILAASFTGLYFYLFVPFTTEQMSGGQIDHNPVSDERGERKLQRGSLLPPPGSRQQHINTNFKAANPAGKKITFYRLTFLSLWENTSKDFGRNQRQ